MQTPRDKARVFPPTKQLLKNDFDLPGYDALTQILHEYQKFPILPKASQLSKQEPKVKNNSKNSSELNKTFEIPTPDKSLQESKDQKDDPLVDEITDHQTKELENYRTAMCKMAEDILELRSQISSLEGENSHLRMELSMQQDLGHTLLEDTDIDVMTKAEIADKIVSLKWKVANETSKAADQRDKIQQLQNELIRKNDSEKELVRLQWLHKQQQAALQRYQTQVKKLARLEATVHQQEKVIERMEKMLITNIGEKTREKAQKKITSNKKEAEECRTREIESVLAAENSRLREELERLRHQPPAVIIQQPAQVQVSESEKLKLLQQLERAEACSRVLGRQLEENARQWGKEKQEMLTRLNEYHHGFAHTSSITLHDLPLVSEQPKPHHDVQNVNTRAH